MKWVNLKINKCPQCDKDFTRGMKTEKTKEGLLMLHKCGFKISEKRYKEIVNNLVESNLNHKRKDYKNE